MVKRSTVCNVAVRANGIAILDATGSLISWTSMSADEARAYAKAFAASVDAKPLAEIP